MSAERYGRYYWCVGLTDTDENDRRVEVYAHADRVEVLPDGTLALYGRFRPGDAEQLTLSFRNPAWRFVYAASEGDGHAVSVEHWPGQIAEERD
jgi:hypothetical protein